MQPLIYQAFATVLTLALVRLRTPPYPTSRQRRKRPLCPATVYIVRNTRPACFCGRNLIDFNLYTILYSIVLQPFANVHIFRRRLPDCGGGWVDAVPFTVCFGLHPFIPSVCGMPAHEPPPCADVLIFNKLKPLYLLVYQALAAAKRFRLCDGVGVVRRRNCTRLSGGVGRWVKKKIILYFHKRIIKM